jgi:hypothetical protein
MGGITEEGALRKDGVRAEGDGGGIVDLGRVGGCDLVAADEVPGRPDVGLGVEVAVGAEAGSVQAQEQSAPGVKGARRRTVKQAPREVPEEAAKTVAARKGGAQVGSEVVSAGRCSAAWYSARCAARDVCVRLSGFISSLCIESCIRSMRCIAFLFKTHRCKKPTGGPN